MQPHVFVQTAAKLLVLLVLLVLIAGCAPVAAPAASTTSAAQPAPRVYFVTPHHGNTVSNPLTVKMGAQDFTVEPAGEVKPNAGHLHIIVDGDCVAPGQGIPKDDTHLHYGQGQKEAELALAPGEHTLCLQAADGNHVALAGDGMTHVIAVKVE